MSSPLDLDLARRLLEKGLLDAARLQEALAAVREQDRPLADILRERGWMPDSFHDTPATRLDGAPPEVAQAAGKPGAVLGKFVLLRELGSGGMGIVYLAWQSDLRRQVALKFLRAGDSPEEVSRFLREAQTAASLSHPGIVPIFETGEIEGRHYISMAYIEGWALDRVIAARPPIRRLVEILHDVARAVHHAHTQGVVHRDLKPGNIMVGGEGRGAACVMDFGLAKSIRTGSSLTVSGMILGTPTYMSPEQASGKPAEVDAQSDVYALGAMLYEIGTGGTPYRGESPMEVVMKILQEDPRAPRRINPRLHADLETITLKAMERSKARRTASAAEFADDLRRWLDGEPIRARPPSLVERWILKLRKHRAVAAALAVAAAAVIVGGWFGVAALLQKARLERQQREAAARREQARPAYEEARYHFERADRMRYIRDADVRHQTEYLALAESSLRAALAEEPKFAEAWTLLGRVLDLLDRMPEAIEAFSRAIELEPGNVSALLGRGLARNALTRAQTSVSSVVRTDIEDVRLEGDEFSFYVEALHPRLEEIDALVQKDLDAAAILSEKPAERAYVAGMAAMSRWTGDNPSTAEQAILHFDEALKLDPNRADAHRARAMALHYLRRDGEALEGLRTAERIAPNEPHTLQNLASMLYAMRRYEDAMAYADRLRELRPRVAGYRGVRALLLSKLQRHDEADAEYRTMRDLGRSDDFLWVDWAVALARAGRAEDAIRMVREGLQSKPDSDFLRDACALLLTQANRHEEAAEVLRPAKKLMSRLNLGVVLVYLGRLDQAEAEYRGVLRREPDHPRATIYLARLRLRQGHAEEALQILEGARVAVKEDTEYAVALATAYHALDRGMEALEWAARAAQLQPRRASVAAVHAEFLLRAGRAAEALEEADRALSIHSENWQAAFQRANALAALKRYAEAEEAFVRVNEKGETWDSRVNYGNLLWERKRPKEGLAQFDRAVAVAPDRAEPWGSRGLAKAKLGDPEGAESDFTEALRRLPGDPMTLRLRAQVRAQLGRTEDALRDADELCASGRADPFAWTLRGNLRAERKRPAEAIADFEKAMDLDARFAPAYIGRARVRFDQGEYAKAVEDYERAVGYAPDLEPALRGEIEQAREKAK